MKKRLFLVLGGLCAAFIAALVGGYLVVSSPAFVRSQVLGRVAQILGTPVTAGDIRFRPFSSIELSDVAIGTGEGRFFTAGRVRCRYRLGGLFRRRLTIDEIRIDKPVVQLVRDAAGRLNLPAVSRPRSTSGGVGPAKETTGAENGDLPVIVRVSGFRISQGQVRYTDAAGKGAGGRAAFVLSALDFEAPAFVLGEKSKLSAAGTAQVSGRRGADFALRTGRIKVRFDCELRPDLRPERVECSVDLDGLTGTAGSIDLADRKLTLRFRVTAKGDVGDRLQIEQFTVTESRRDVPEAELRVTGTVTPSRPTGALSVELGPVAPAVLNLVGRIAGDYDFGQTRVAYRGKLGLAPGPELTAAGVFEARDASLTSAGFGTGGGPPLNVRIAHDVDLNLARGAVRVSRFETTVAAGAHEFLRTSLTAPVFFAWKADGEGGPADPGPAQLKLVLDRFPLSRFGRPFLEKTKTAIDAGTLDLTAKVDIREKGKQLKLSGQAVLRDLALRTPQFACKGVTVRQSFELGVRDLAKFRLATAQTRLSVGGKEAADLALTGKFDRGTGTGTVDLTIADLNRRCLDLVPAALLGGVAVDRFGLTGRARLSVANAGRDLGVDVALRLPEVSADLPGGRRLSSVGVDVRLRGGVARGKPVDIEELALQVDSQGRTVARLGVRGTLALPLGTGRSVLEVTTDGIDAGAAAGLIRAVRPETTPKGASAKGKSAAEAPAKAPVPAAVSATVNLDLKNIRYGEINVESCRGRVVLDNAVVTVGPLDLVVNGAPVQWRGRVDLGRPGLAYRMKGHIERLPIQPFAKTFAPDLGDGLRGMVQMFDLDLAGRGLEPAAILKTLTVRAGLKLKSLVIPADPQRLTRRPGVRLLLLPFQVLGQVTALVPANRLPGTARDLSAKSKRLLGKAGEITFDATEMLVAGEGGRINLPKCELRNPIIPDLTFQGTLDFRPIPATAALGEIDPALNLRIGMRVGGVALTIPVGGTLRHPKPDTQALIRGLVRGVGETLLKSAAETLKQGGKLRGRDLLKQLLRGTGEGGAGKQSEELAPEKAQSAGAEKGKAAQQNEKAPEKQQRDVLLDVLGDVLGQPRQKTEPASAGAQRTEQEPENAKPAAPTKAERRKARRRALEQLGGQLLQNLLERNKPE
ncbi:MAG: DUF748 domain-containing protein [Kiritimatiellaeota bacterium]|nr:DUF748 domain-containing protein [Kiritimatiellota bacterium]